MSATRRSVGERAQLAEKTRIDDPHAALALHGLDDHRGCPFRVDDLRQLLDIPLGDRHAPCEWLERGAVLYAICRGEHAHRAPVERTAERDDLVLGRSSKGARRLGRARGHEGARPAPRELERALVCFRPRVAEERPSREGVRHEELGQLLAGLRAEEVGDVDEAALGRVAHRLHEARVAVAERVDGDPAREIEVAPAGLVVQRHALAAHEAHRRALVRAEQTVGGGGDAVVGDVIDTGATAGVAGAGVTSGATSGATRVAMDGAVVRAVTRAVWSSGAAKNGVSPGVRRRGHPSCRRWPCRPMDRRARPRHRCARG